MGGAALNPEVERIFKKINFPYLVGYGMTEACPLLAYEHWTKYVPGSCGKPVDCAEVRIDSDDPQHTVGEIQARGESKNMILGPSGQNIYPEEVEAVVNNQAYVLESVVVDRGGKLVGLVYLDQQAIARDLLDPEAVSEIPEKIRSASNKRLPGYSQLSKVEVMDEPFAKTPKMSIKRFLYK